MNSDILALIFKGNGKVFRLLSRGCYEHHRKYFYVYIKESRRVPVFFKDQFNHPLIKLNLYVEQAPSNPWIVYDLIVIIQEEDQDISYISQMINLEYLMVGLEFNINTVVPNNNLKKLEIDGNGFDIDIGFVVGFSNLMVLDVNENVIDLKFVFELTNLRKLNIIGIKPEEIKYLPKLKKLEFLRFKYITGVLVEDTIDEELVEVWEEQHDDSDNMWDLYMCEGKYHTSIRRADDPYHEKEMSFIQRYSYYDPDLYTILDYSQTTEDMDRYELNLCNIHVYNNVLLLPLLKLKNLKIVDGNEWNNNLRDLFVTRKVKVRDY